MTQNLNLKNTKAKIDQLVAQVKESVKVLEALQKEGVNRVRSMLRSPSKELAQKITNEKIVNGLKKVGIATRSEVRDLEKKVEELASELRAQINQVSKAARKSQKSSKPAETETDANA